MFMTAKLNFVKQLLSINCSEGIKEKTLEKKENKISEKKKRKCS